MSMNSFHARRSKPRSVAAPASTPRRAAGLTRADILLAQQGLAASRTEAQALIKAGRVRWAGGVITKAAQEFCDDTALTLTDSGETHYVSRGGFKLAGALAKTGLSVTGRICLDIGQSTGGFTDCLLQAGAAQVIGIDVGHGQLHPRLQADSRVKSFEGLNARSLSAFDFEQFLFDSAQGSPSPLTPLPQAGEGMFTRCQQDISPRRRLSPLALVGESLNNSPLPLAGEGSGERGLADGKASYDKRGFDLIVADVSFISLTLILPRLPALLNENGNLLLLVKPQFEVGPAGIGKGGLVRNPALYTEVEGKLRTSALASRLRVLDWFESSITGSDGNREFFIWMTHEP